MVGRYNNEIIGARTTPRRTSESYTSTCGKIIRCVAIGSFPITTCNNYKKNLNLRNMNRHNMGVNTRISIGTSYLQHHMSILPIANSGLGFPEHNLHYEWDNVKGVVNCNN
jgi:hypothetical protein